MIFKRIFELIKLEIDAILYPDMSHRMYSIGTLPIRLSNIILNRKRFKWKKSSIEFESRFGSILVQVHDQIAKQLKDTIAIHKNFTVLDIGANIGQFGFAMLNNFEDIEIHSFEPNAQPFDILAKNAQCFKNWKIYKYGIGSQNEFVDFYWVPGKSGQGSIHRENAYQSVFLSTESNVEKSKIEMITSTDIPNKTGLNMFDLIKIDVEGAEATVLDQVKLLNWRFLVVEVGKNREGSIDSSKVIQALSTYKASPKIIGVIGREKDDTYDLIIENEVKTFPGSNT
jgi:FkbM family methyltransferase